MISTDVILAAAGLIILVWRSGPISARFTPVFLRRRKILEIYEGLPGTPRGSI